GRGGAGACADRGWAAGGGAGRASGCGPGDRGRSGAARADGGRGHAGGGSAERRGAADGQEGVVRGVRGVLPDRPAAGAARGVTARSSNAAPATAAPFPEERLLAGAVTWIPALPGGRRETSAATVQRRAARTGW